MGEGRRHIDRPLRARATKERERDRGGREGGERGQRQRDRNRDTGREAEGKEERKRQEVGKAHLLEGNVANM